MKVRSESVEALDRAKAHGVESSTTDGTGRHGRASDGRTHQTPHVRPVEHRRRTRPLWPSLQAVRPVDFAHGLGDEDQVDDHPDADHEQRAVADQRGSWVIVESEWEASESDEQHCPGGPRLAKVEPVSSHSAKEDCEHVGGNVGLLPGLANQNGTGLRSRRLRCVDRPPGRAVPPLQLSVRVEMPARFWRRRRSGLDSTVTGLPS